MNILELTNAYQKARNILNTERENRVLYQYFYDNLDAEDFENAGYGTASLNQAISMLAAYMAEQAQDELGYSAKKLARVNFHKLAVLAIYDYSFTLSED